jgi:beta-glucosidase
VGVQQGKVLSLMASYNEISGVPSHASKWLLTDVLRKEWGFNGYVVSDYYGVVELHVRHSVAADSAEAAKMALEAGVEVELPDSACYNKIVSLVKTGRMKESVLDTAVARILRIKFLTGLFDNPYVSPDEAEKVTATPEKIALAKQAALESITLLKNSNNILPLNTKKLKTIAVVGPNADRTLLGGYAGLPRQKVSPLQGIKNAVGESVKVLYAEGCKITDVEKDYYGWFEDNIELPKPEDEAKRMAEAVSIAKQSDVIVFCIGQNEQISREAWAEAHMGDRSNLELIGNQNALFKALKATGKPIIVAIFNGSPVSFTHIAENADAILECWYLGQEGGNALADVLLGKYNPSGKLPISIPRSVGHIPAFYNYKPTARRGYIFDDITPLYPFGYGLSYTTFEYDSTSLQLSKKEIATNENVTVSINVKNTGNLAGKETVQLYIRDKVSSVTRPVKELKDFAQIKLEAGETKTVSFTITPEKLAFYDINMNFTVEAGEFELMLGSSSQDKDLKKITLKVK